MKTALQDMLEWTRKTFPMDLDTPRMIEDKIQSLIEKEKEQIYDAYCNGYGNSSDYKEISAIDYYEQTFN